MGVAGPRVVERLICSRRHGLPAGSDCDCVACAGARCAAHPGPRIVVARCMWWSELARPAGTKFPGRAPVPQCPPRPLARVPPCPRPPAAPQPPQRSPRCAPCALRVVGPRYPGPSQPATGRKASVHGAGRMDCWFEAGGQGRRARPVGMAHRAVQGQGQGRSAAVQPMLFLGLPSSGLPCRSLLLVLPWSHLGLTSVSPRSHPWSHPWSYLGLTWEGAHPR